MMTNTDGKFVTAKNASGPVFKVAILPLLTRVAWKQLQIDTVCARVYFNFNVAAHNDDESDVDKCQLQYIANKNVQQAHLN